MKKRFLDIVAEEKGTQYKTIYEAISNLPAKETFELLEGVEDLDDAALVLLDFYTSLKHNLECAGLFLSKIREYRINADAMDEKDVPHDFSEFWAAYILGLKYEEEN